VSRPSIQSVADSESDFPNSILTPLCAPRGAGMWGAYLAALHGWGPLPQGKGC